jgi:hypothetical protein
MVSPTLAIEGVEALFELGEALIEGGLLLLEAFNYVRQVVALRRCMLWRRALNQLLGSLFSSLRCLILLKTL